MSSEARVGTVPGKHSAPGALSRSLIGPARERAHQADRRRRTPAHHSAGRAAGSFSASMLSQRPLPGCGPGRMHGHPARGTAATSPSGPATGTPTPNWPNRHPGCAPWPRTPPSPSCCSTLATATTPKPTPISSPYSSP